MSPPIDIIAEIEDYSSVNGAPHVADRDGKRFKGIYDLIKWN